MTNSDSPRRPRVTREQSESAAREIFPAPLTNEELNWFVDRSNKIEGALNRLEHEPLRLGRQFAELVAVVTKGYMETFGDSSETRRRAMTDVLAFLSRTLGVSQSKVRLYLNAWQKVHARPEALAFLRMTDMQLLLGQHIGDAIIDAVIERRRADLTMSTREVRALIARLQRDEQGPAGHESGLGAPSQ